MRDTIIAIVLLAVIAGGSWAWFKYAGPPEAAVGPSLEETRSDNERLRQYRQINKVEVDLSILDNSIFKSLRSGRAAAGIATSTVPTGRANPFAPF